MVAGASSSSSRRSGAAPSGATPPPSPPSCATRVHSTTTGERGWHLAPGASTAGAPCRRGKSRLGDCGPILTTAASSRAVAVPHRAAARRPRRPSPAERGREAAAPGPGARRARLFARGTFTSAQFRASEEPTEPRRPASSSVLVRLGKWITRHARRYFPPVPMPSAERRRSDAIAPTPRPRPRACPSRARQRSSAGCGLERRAASATGEVAVSWLAALALRTPLLHSARAPGARDASASSITTASPTGAPPLPPLLHAPAQHHVALGRLGVGAARGVGALLLRDLGQKVAAAPGRAQLDGGTALLPTPR